MTLSAADTIAQLTALIGSDAVIGDAGKMGAWLNEPRKRFHQKAAAIALPASVEQVQAIVRWAGETGTGLIPQGGNTGLVGAQVPLRGDEVIVSLGKLDRIRAVDVAASRSLSDAIDRAEGRIERHDIRRQYFRLSRAVGTA